MPARKRRDYHEGPRGRPDHKRIKEEYAKYGLRVNEDIMLKWRGMSPEDMKTIDALPHNFSNDHGDILRLSEKTGIPPGTLSGMVRVKRLYMH